MLNKIEKNPCVGVTIKGERKKKDIQFIEFKDIPIFLQEEYKYGYSVD